MRAGKSEAQSNAEALARRSSTYADEHAASWQVRFDRGTPPEGYRTLAFTLRKAYEDEVPTAIHRHDVDGGGTPAYTGEFASFLYGSVWATDKDDDTYRTPVRATLAGMLHSKEGATQQMGRLAARVIVGGDDAGQAMEREMGWPIEPWISRLAVERALLVCWKRCSNVRMDLGKSRTAA